MSIVTRITQAEHLTRRKLNDLHALCKVLGKVRAYVWRKYGSIKGVGKTKYEIRDAAILEFKKLAIASHVIGSTAIDAADYIKSSFEAAKSSIIRAIFRRVKDAHERKRLCVALKWDTSNDNVESWTKDRYLRRKMRKARGRGRSKCVNQIVLSPDCYKWFEVNGRAFVSIKGFLRFSGKYPNRNRYRQIAIPVSSNHKITGQIRIIVNGNNVSINHYLDVVSEHQCGSDTIGIDKGYTEVFIDSDGKSHGDGLGEILTKESDAVKKKCQSRNKLAAIAKKSEPKKRARIEKNNLGKKKWSKHKARHKKIVSTKIHEGAHSVVSKANVIAVEDLTMDFEFKNRGKNANRRLSGWTKGVIASALKNVALRRGASVKLVNAAYTSQTCPTCGCLGRRTGDTFHCAVCKDVKRSDHVSALNVLGRLTDKEISLYTPYREVKAIIQRRSAPRLRLSNQDSSCVGTAGIPLAASTESELPNHDSDTFEFGMEQRTSGYDHIPIVLLLLVRALIRGPLIVVRAIRLLAVRFVGRLAEALAEPRADVRAHRAGIDETRQYYQKSDYCKSTFHDVLLCLKFPLFDFIGRCPGISTTGRMSWVFGV